MARVVAQGDTRPMAGHAEAMDDLRQILSSRESLYGKADAVVDTSGSTAQESFEALHAALTRGPLLADSARGHHSRATGMRHS